MSLRTQEVITALGDLLTGRRWVVVKPRDPERPISEGGYVIRVEGRLRNG